jgi:hypothetical protein
MFRDFGLTLNSESGLQSQSYAQEWQKMIPQGLSQELEMKIILNYAKALFCGNVRSLHSRRSTHEETLDEFLAFLVLVCGEWAPLSSSLKSRGQAKLSKAGAAEIFHLKARVERLNITRRLFSTSCGFIGNGPQVLQPGDCVCILFGGDVPYILRPEGDHYLMVGESYVSDIMDGEFISSWKNGKNPSALEKEFRLY